MPKRKCSEKTKRKISDSSKGVTKSEQHKQALSLAKLRKPTRTWKGKKFSEAHREKLKGRKALLYRKHFIVIENNITKEYIMTKSDLCKELKLSPITLNQCLIGDYPVKRQIKIYEKSD